MSSQTAECITAVDMEARQPQGGGLAGLAQAIDSAVERAGNAIACLPYPISDPVYDPCLRPVESQRPLPGEENGYREQARRGQDAVRSLFSPDQSGFDTLDQAAIVATNWIRYTSIAEGREYAGRIYRRNGVYHFSPPVPGDAHSSQPSESPVPRDATVVAAYHTHGGAFDWSDEYFSQTDLLSTAMSNRPSYVTTPRGHILRADPVDPDADPDITASQCPAGGGSATISQVGN